MEGAFSNHCSIGSDGVGLSRATFVYHDHDNPTCYQV